MIRFSSLAILGLLAGPTVAAEPAPSVYCSTAEQIDALIELVGRGASPAQAVAALDGCTRADRVAWLVINPEPVDSTRGDGRFRYRAMLIGVIVEGAVEGVDPPTYVYFFRDKPYDGASTDA